MLPQEMASCTRAWQRSLAPMPACPSTLIRVLLQICPDIPDNLTLALAVCQDVSLSGLDVPHVSKPSSWLRGSGEGHEK